MATSTRVPPKRAGIRYSPPVPGTPESARVLAYRARKAVVRRLEQLVAAGHFDQAVQYALPITAVLDTAPTVTRMLDLLDQLTLVDAREDVARALYRQDPDGQRRSYIAHLHLTIQRMTAAVRALEADAGA